MQKILILWLWAFGFAVAKHLGNIHPKKHFFAYERNPEIISSLEATRTHPYFFEWEKLPENIELIPQLESILPEIDLIISIIPCQFVASSFHEMKNSLKDWVTILNLAKGIDNKSLQTISEKLQEILSQAPSVLRTPPSTKEAYKKKFPLVEGDTCEAGGGVYTYAYLAGGMIAQELVDEKQLWADIVCENETLWNELKKLFESNTLHIKVKIWHPKNTELYAALKNIVALILWYYEGQWAGASTLGYYFSTLLTEIKWVIELLHINSLYEEDKYDFTDYALSGDLIATCFGASRNRLLWNMLGQGKNIEAALEELRSQKKIAEGYETLKWIYTLTQWKEGFEEINTFGEKYL